MAFWAVEIKPGKPFTHTYDGSKGRLHISMATLGHGTAITKSTLQCNVGNKSPVYLCSLYPGAGNTESLQLNLELEEDCNVIFSVIGPRSIHLCGYYLARGRYNNTLDESESYGEDIADTENEKSAHSDEDDYDDSFIDDDGDLEVFPPSPISNEEDASYDSGRKSAKGSRRRMRKKYQLIESDDDIGLEEKKIVNDSVHVQSQEIDNEDCLPISSICKNKASGRILDQAMDENVEEDAVDTGKKDSEDPENSPIETKLKTDDVVADNQTHREAEPSDHLAVPCTVPDVGDIKKSKKKKKGKEKETKSSCNDHSTESDNAVQEKEKMNTAQDLLDQEMTDNVDSEAVDAGKKDSEDPENSTIETKLKIDDVVADIPTHRKAETADKILPFLQVGQGQDDKPKRKRKERSKEETIFTVDDACISNVDNLPQGNEGNNQDIVNRDVKISDSVALPSTETDSPKKTKRRKKEQKNKASLPEGDNGNSEGIIHDEKANNETAESGRLIHELSETKEQHQKLTIENSGNNGAQDNPDGNQSEDKKVKKKKKKSKSQGSEAVNSDLPVSVEPSTEMMKEDGNNMEDTKSSQVRTLSNGLVIQELETGKENGKIAALGKKISINYTGKLKENGAEVESNAGQAPFKFRLGKGEVIEGLDIGLEGMRVGEKRRLVIPPSMTSKKNGDSENIPPNSWLIYELELVKVH
ncbi:peptidyl-prolyl cis-trans isomerase FKBP43-like isoform X9 [Trifolium pratense]|uniref:peptidyl-prolyl cis-trans isomerase FKBP43-like isoform X9 n=1 Tax=Trifolium pratense TaxID=57577 RepID=UPI001E694CDD|nr:peptidyl-prolyl cis-trans isomerase FKBP43-like isoform X9 [Trifolium pratense]